MVHHNQVQKKHGVDREIRVMRYISCIGYQFGIIINSRGLIIKLSTCNALHPRRALRLLEKPKQEHTGKQYPANGESL